MTEPHKLLYENGGTTGATSTDMYEYRAQTLLPPANTISKSHVAYL
jgi:hypothetical protein